MLLWTSIFAFSVGYGPVTYILTGEMFPLSIKEVGCTIVFTARFLVNFGQLKMYPVWLEWAGL